ncbi:hypothetical protein ACFLZY_02820 [Patescibacteria group bacterium]
MILVHRVTPFLVGLITAAGYAALLVLEKNQFGWVLFSVVLVALLLARLIGWQWRNFQFWNLLITPLLFIISGIGVFLFFENQPERIALTVLVPIFVFFFAEHVFAYIHLPTKYQAYAIEHLSLILSIVSIFFVGIIGFGTRLLMITPLYILVPIFFTVSLFVIYGTLWVSKVEHKQARPYALSLSVLVTELFMSMTFLPTGFYTNAAVLALCFYVLLGLTRAHFLNRLTRTVLKRYLILGAVLLVVIVGTAKWI